MYSLNFFGSSISFYPSSSSLSNDGKHVFGFLFSFSLFSVLVRGSVLRFSWGFHTKGSDRQVGSTQKKKMPGANRSLLRFMFALCLTLRAAKGYRGRVRSAYTYWTLFLFCLFVFFCRSSVFTIVRYPLTAQAYIQFLFLFS